MIIHNLVNNIKTIRAMNAVAAGTTDQTSSWIDTLGFHGVLFTVLFGTLTATQVTSIKLQYSSDGSASAGDVAGSASAALADTDGNKMLQVEVYRPKYRYVRLYIDRGTANAVIDGVIAQLFHADHVPVTKDSSVAATPEIFNAAAVGTA